MSETSESCADCRFFKPETNLAGQPTDRGSCRGAPPANMEFPLVRAADWCGYFDREEQDSPAVKGFAAQFVDSQFTAEERKVLADVRKIWGVGGEGN